ncbi:MAG: DUF4446 family protein [Lachnospiraceae bacterium]|nr:DUF4446 family protein [Lachnospiraceae bacterium]
MGGEFELLSLTGLMIFLILLSLILNAVLFFMLSSESRKRRELELRLRRFTRGSGGDNLEDTMLRMFDEHEEIHQILDREDREIDEIQDRLRNAIQKVGVIKYDAFNQMGGNLSSSIALLNENNDGVIINTVQSVDGCYSYVKQIRDGRPDVDLGKEENEALEQAMYG